MNKKLYFALIFALVLIPAVTAAISEGIENMLGTIFDAPEDLAYVKAGMWLVIFYLVFKSTERIFPSSRGMNVVISLVVSLLGARFMPEDYIGYLGWWFIVVLLLGLPFFLGSFFGSLARFGRMGKTILIIVLYGVFAYYALYWQGFVIGGEAQDVLDMALEWINEHSILVLIIIGAFCVYLLWGSGKSGRGGGGGGVKGPGFWSGFGKGAGQASGWLSQKGKLQAMRGMNWFKRRAMAKQAAAQQASQLKKKINLAGNPSAKVGWFARRRAAKQAVQRAAQQAFKPPMRINLMGKKQKIGFFTRAKGWFARRRIVQKRELKRLEKEMQAYKGMDIKRNVGPKYPEYKTKRDRSEVIRQNLGLVQKKGAPTGVGKSGEEVSSILKKYKKKLKER